MVGSMPRVTQDSSSISGPMNRLIEITLFIFRKFSEYERGRILMLRELALCPLGALELPCLQDVRWYPLGLSARPQTHSDASEWC